MDERGGITYAVVALIFVVFICCFFYSIFNQPVSEVVSGSENAASETPSGIFDNLNLTWGMWPVVLVIAGVIAVVFLVYKHEMEHSYRGAFG